jgi:hypothetical protein
VVDSTKRIRALQEADTTWMNDAKCRTEKKNVQFFFEHFEKSSKSDKNRMVSFCSPCAVRQACYDHAISVGETGLWGGVYFASGKPQNPLRARYLEDSRDIAASQKRS